MVDNPGRAASPRRPQDAPKRSDLIFDAAGLPPAALERKHRLERDPSCRTDPMAYLPGMEVIDSDLKDRVRAAISSYDPSAYTAADVRRALERERCGEDELRALLSPAAAPFLEKMAERARAETVKHFGNTVYIFTPLYIANHCENYCVYCGFNCYNPIRRMKLDKAQIEREMEVIARSGMEEVLILTGESRSASGVEYIGDACELARKYFRLVGLEVYPMNTDEYRYLRERGADYVTVFQETYDVEQYEKLHLMGRKRVWPYRFDAQERALRGGMRGVAFSALLGLSDFRKDALATALHACWLQRKYPEAEISLSCPRLRPIANHADIRPGEIGERELCQVLCAYRLFLPFAGITVSSRESASFRNGITKIAATKVSAGVSTGIGDHASKYGEAPDSDREGDEQFEISDARSLAKMYADLTGEGLQPVLNDYVYV
ncbi:MAG: 2-iminoacetate synthase ThiH [Kiritimatiellae bacterium]|nr:2-iminoacetate synthase ThiH [Kiritimatiellia bacterium]